MELLFLSVKCKKENGDHRFLLNPILKVNIENGEGIKIKVDYECNFTFHVPKTYPKNKESKSDTNSMTEITEVK
ncbi:CLUMA_CG012737, isoform A [Clunio marinus]|uniref:CLUMA_CG012737, isoform A n=1 Tax=Clunio marinus TaxID=568069 RepID=A0A1J1IJM9_9DIPT|nr:CLUMA_CG012737, isoform A [Clunio marinus]